MEGARHVSLVISGHTVLVDRTDLPRIAERSWHVRKFGGLLYVHSTGGLSMHKFLMGTTGRTKVDHKNHNGLDNRRSNLRAATHQQNIWNRRKLFPAASPYKGVTFVSRSRVNPWKAGISIQVGEKRQWRHLGCFPTQELAAAAYDQAARELFGAFACLNFPKSGESAALLTLPQQQAA